VILFFSFIIATFVTMILIPPLMRLAQRLPIVDIPSERKIHKNPVPRVGGIAMAAGAVLPLIMWAPFQPQVAGFLFGVAIILLFGVWDDFGDIDYRLKFLGQIAATLVVVTYGGVVIRYVPFFGLEPLPAYIAIPLTVVALVGITNAINLADGLDGLAGGMMLLSLGIIAIMAYMSDGANLVLVTVAVMGSILGFLRFNTYPARIFMGDGGSQFLGFSAAVLVVILTQETNTALSPALPCMILGLPILDTLMVMSQRIYEGRSPFVPDKNHIHHKLLVLGFDHYEAVFVIYLLQSVLVLGAYLLRFESDWLILSLYALFCIALLACLHIAATTGWRMRSHRHELDTPFVPKWIQLLRTGQWPLRVAFYLGIISVSAYLFLGAFFVGKVPRDIGALACALLGMLLVLFFKQRGRAFNIFERAGAYVAGILVVYLVQVTPGPLADFAPYRNTVFVMMTMAVVIGFRFSKERFQITPMDFLVVFIALVVPSLPGFDLIAGSTEVDIAMLIVLFYGIELVVNNIRRRWDMMRLTTYITLAVLGLRGVTAF
jgi:UDP-GlcNAc:undecaprenyl-phosphate GlcNAc-1-phosphate transferase